MKLSVVSTMYRSAQYLEEFYSRVSAAAAKVTDDYEIILVNDGCPEGSLECSIKIFGSDPKVKVVDLSANFGHHKAIVTGLEHARGDLVFLIDCDLEEPPELLGRMFDAFVADGNCDVVYGVQKYRKGDYFERFTGWVFYKLVNMLADLKVPANITTARLMSARYVRSLVAFRDRELFLAGTMQAAGYRQLPIEVEKLSKGKSTYTFARKVNVTINAITSFSAKPLLFIFYTGLAISLTSGAFIAYLLYQKLVYNMQRGWTSLIVSIWFLGGLTIFSAGLIGIYLAKAFSEVKDRPYTVIRRIYSHDGGMEEDKI